MGAHVHVPQLALLARLGVVKDLAAITVLHPGLAQLLVDLLQVVRLEHHFTPFTDLVAGHAVRVPLGLAIPAMALGGRLILLLLPFIE